ncbi:MAG: hypothetical protein QM736_30095 [Vicinamibacterales bacterium]
MPTRVLVIEDDPAIAELVDFHLSRAGHTVTHVSTARDALDATAAQTFELLGPRSRPARLRRHHRVPAYSP